MTITEAKIYIQKELCDYYPKNELISFTRIILEDVFCLSSVDMLLNRGYIFSDEGESKLQNIINRLKKFEPLQYIVGFTFFFDLKINLTEYVLIPRPETEELVNLIISETEQMEGLLVLDIGTGSGCIAVSLAKNLSGANVYAIDICEKALKTAKSNASENNAHVSFIQADILNPNSLGEVNRFDIIVSNPPYVLNSEKAHMGKNVLNYEPGSALFVENNNPLVFYKAIVKFAKQNLRSSGRLYFEINEQFGGKIKNMLEKSGFKSIKIFKDIKGKNRMVRCNL
ncbi:MAG: peptide chain release factor N(5)-glutamine methyltransferase [Bacteroidales bacterium]|nr:peptide chain release factor N(5)-glutamine methyltransferase [Bacteroidales bacterium]